MEKETKTQITFQAKPRSGTRKSACRALRRSGFIPGNLYGAGEQNQPLAVDRKSAEMILRHMSGHNVIADLVVEGNKEALKTVVKEIQHHPITGEVLHLDFYHIGANQPIVLNIPLRFVGECPGVKEGGVLDHALWEIEVEGLPDKIPQAIEIDISSLMIGDSIQVNGIQAPEGLKIRTTPEQMVATVLAPTKVVEPVAAEAVVTEEVAQPEVITQEIAEERRKEKESKKAAESAE